MYDLAAARRQSGAYDAGSYEVIVIGAGHAGSEAALASARLGRSTLLLSMNLDAVANLPCNPSIGGTAKGQLVREIDALGGEMGRIADLSMIQFRMLNASKGPAVLSPRAQIDRRRYQILMKQVLEQQERLHLRQGEAIHLISEPDPAAAGHFRVVGVQLKTQAIFLAPAVIVATGTYLESKVIMGECQYASGPDNHFPAVGLSDSLRELDLPLQRFKTGTPVRINRRTARLDTLDVQEGDAVIVPFSFEHEAASLSLPRQVPCYLTWTTAETRRLVEQNLDRSPLFSGAIDGVGPRYCPSIEDKFVKFPDKARHQIFIEPTGLESEELYVQGLSSSMPEDVQKAMLASLPGMADAQIMRSAYAIEYDCLDPTSLRLSLETRQVRGLFCAGQINGSSGYEEAAAQGLIAGINAVRGLSGQDPLILDRSQAYIGVLIDDLVTKGTMEPYRLMTSRAEFRLLLRQDNADSRLTPVGHSIGLISEDRWQRFTDKQNRIDAEVQRCREVRVKPSDTVRRWLADRNSAPISQGVSLADLLRRPELSYVALGALDPQRPALRPEEQFSVEVQLKYEGYIQLEHQRLRRHARHEQRGLPPDLPYLEISGLRLEARQKLDRLRPATLGQASRISGVSPADISVLMVYLQAEERRRNESRSSDHE
ncbi:MAG: tRNA uridine-5-carboxymethylaminomethyl(34) synthesis enzyme MnmG [Eubacteriales bacterium]|nr:tRNA uridine-5-carboxymethylaminomethyl(34) synthesis enzyme MnmG [Eubacteriales bacterium]MDD3866746.1 tRNA uridine-5-carboxymethylaminomethyl(34) synthesis enzyme MnmG [Eubacteriales bacterium]